MAMTADIRLQSYLVKSPPVTHPDDPTLSRWHRRYFLLRSDNLEYYVDHSKRAKKGEINRASIREVTEFSDSKKFSHLFSVKTDERVYFFSADSEDLKNEWIRALTQEDEQHQVKIIPGRAGSQASQMSRGSVASSAGNRNRATSSPDSVRLNSDNSIRHADEKKSYKAVRDGDEYWLVINPRPQPCIEMRDAESKALLDHWPIKFMRGYGQDHCTFSFEAGRRCPSGAGIHTFELEPGVDLFSDLEAIVEMNEALLPPVDSNKNDCGGHPAAGSIDAVLGEPTYEENPVKAPAGTKGMNYVQVTPIFQPKKTNEEESSVSYVTVDIARTEALGKTMKQRQLGSSLHGGKSGGRATRHDAGGGRKTRHDVSIPEHAAVATSKIREETSSPAATRNKTMKKQDSNDDLEALLTSLEMKTLGASKSEEQRRSSAPERSSQSYVNVSFDQQDRRSSDGPGKNVTLKETGSNSYVNVSFDNNGTSNN